MKNTSGLLKGRNPPSEIRIDLLLEGLYNGLNFVKAAKRAGYKKPYGLKYRLKSKYPDIYQQVIEVEEYFTGMLIDNAKQRLTEALNSTNQRIKVRACMYILSHLDPSFSKKRIIKHQQSMDNVIIIIGDEGNYITKKH